MAIGLDEVRKVAQLARLQLSEEELAQMQEQLSRILDHIAMLQEVDVAAVPPTAQATDISNMLRPDAVRPSLPREDVLLNAPDAQDGMFRIPAVFEDE